MSQQQIKAQGYTYTVVDDTTMRFNALIFGLLSDAVSQQAISAFTIATDHPLIEARRAAPGIFVLAGVTDGAFPDRTRDYVVNLSITAPTYRPLTHAIAIHPTTLLPLDLGELMLLPLPVSLRGRVTQANGNGSPIAGARITLVDDPNPPPATEHPLVLSQPLVLDHPVGTVARECQLTPVGSQRRVVFAAQAGAISLALDDLSGLAPGDLLRFDAGEHNFVAAVGSPRAYEITLRHPLQASLNAGALAQPITVTIPGGGASAQLTQPAQAGDGVLILDAALGVDAVEIDSAAAVEYRAVGALTNADGFYRLNGITRLQSLWLEAAAAGWSPLASPVRHVVVYDAGAANVVDFTLEP